MQSVESRSYNVETQILSVDVTDDLAFIVNVHANAKQPRADIGHRADPGIHMDDGRYTIVQQMLKGKILGVSF